MFCASLEARGRSILTECFITGTVMMKMMSSTSMMSTMGVMLISFITSSLSSWVPKAMVLLDRWVGPLASAWGRMDGPSGLFHGHDVGLAAGAHAGTGH